MTLTDLLFSQEFLMNAPDMFYDIFPVIVLFGTLAVLLILGVFIGRMTELGRAHRLLDRTGCFSHGICRFPTR
ncbi:hypothetical protein K6102_16920 [Vibrio furnissii]|uniref:hypothetical protein n=1 Tax=Vibrio furnissii TaxID=29494 RepID=UPI001EEB8627|nr:hypothetical protein [Vibrio furnissii]MCG6234696.1 hypothetical protein [Vibrio furnissii]